jgi:hypothetical protein
VREFRTLGSARGAARKGGPYRDWEVLPDRNVRPPATHQHLPGAVGPQKVQTVQGIQASETLVDLAHATTAQDVRPLGMDARVLTDQMRRAE